MKIRMGGPLLLWREKPHERASAQWEREIHCFLNHDSTKFSQSKERNSGLNACHGSLPHPKTKHHNCTKNAPQRRPQDELEFL